MSTIQKTVSKSSVGLYESEGRTALKPSVKQGLLSMQVSQLISTKSSYPGQMMNNNFTNISFNQIPSKPNLEFESVTRRVAWVEVGGDTTLEMATEYLDSVSDQAVIYQILSNQPIITEGQKRAIQEGLTSIEAIAKRQILKSKVDGELMIQKDKTNKFQYKVNHFSEVPMEDMDLRGNEEYSNEEIVAEYDRQIGIPALKEPVAKSIVTDLVAA